MADTQLLIDSHETNHLLGWHEMDSMHDEFIQMINALSTAKTTEFRSLFLQLFQHTQQHFELEKELMVHSAFPATSEHVAEHQRVLGELDRFSSKVSNGIFMFARAYIREHIPDWFNLHLNTMDSALVAHLSQSSEVVKNEI